jgi:uncharacterized RDD family membrane protein YckC
MSPSSSGAGKLGQGVFFAPQHYAGLLRRCVVYAIDLCVLWLAWTISYAAWTRFLQDETLAIDVAAYVWLSFSFLYLTLLKASRFGTVGFLLGGVKIVNLKGERPSIFRMILRLLLWLFGPFNILYDFIWLSGDECKQSLRDKLAGTYVVRKGALPAGRGPLKLTRLFVLGFNLTFLEVKKPLAI